MNPGTPCNHDETEEIPLCSAETRFGMRKYLTGVIRWTSRPSQRLTLNLALLTVVLPVLLLSLALITFFNSIIPLPNQANDTASQQVDLALERVLETQATALAAIASDPNFTSLASGAEEKTHRLEQLHQAHSEFESLALVNARGGVEVSAGILHQDYYLWQNTPAFHDSLNNKGHPSISPLKFGALSLDADGRVNLSDSRIERLVFTAGTEELDASGHGSRLMVGIIKTDSLMDSAYRLLNESQASQENSHFLLELSQKEVVGQGPDSNIQLLSVDSGKLDQVGGDTIQRDELPVEKPITPFKESESSWYSILPGASIRQIDRAGTNSIAMALAVLSVSLMLVAGWVILKSPKEPQLQLAVSHPEHTQSSDHLSSTAAAMSQRLMEVEESVRREMADYLHGHVQSKLLALSMSLGTCQKLMDRDPGQASHILNEIQGELQKVQDEDLRQVSGELYPAIIKMGLVPAMRSLTSRFNDMMEIDLIIDTDVFVLDSEGEDGLPEKQRLGVYRIAEEALSNVIKHAQASSVEITLLSREPHSLVMSITDDGCGFDPGGTANSHGLVLMADYAEAIGGHTDISSAPEQGTTITLSLDSTPRNPNS